MNTQIHTHTHTHTHTHIFSWKEKWMDAYEGGLGRDLYFLLNRVYSWFMGCPDCSASKESTCNAGDSGLTPGSGRSPAEGNGNLLQYSCLEKSMDRGGCQVQSMGSQRVGHDWATNTPSWFTTFCWSQVDSKATQLHTYTCTYTHTRVFFFRFFPIIGYYELVNAAIFVVYLFYI